MFILGTFLQFHFFSVVYTHWKNYAKDHSSDVEMRRLAEENQA